MFSPVTEYKRVVDDVLYTNMCKTALISPI